MIVELEGLEVFGRHGVLEDERRDGRNVLLRHLARGVRRRPLRPARGRGRLPRGRRLRAGGLGRQQFQLIEALAGAVADAIVERFPVEHVRVRVRKPDPRPAGLQVAYSAAIAERAGS